MYYSDNVNYVTGILDRNGGKFESNKKTIAQQWVHFQAEFNMEDALRYQYPNMIRYSFSNVNQAGKLKYMLQPKY